MTTIFVDMDQTLNMFWKSFALEMKIESFEKEQLVHYEIIDCLFPEKMGIVQSTMLLNKVFSKKGFWENIPIQDNAYEVMKKLNKTFDVYIVTAPWIDYNKCYEEKTNWVEKHLDFFDVSKIVFTKDKHLLTGDYIIDDAPKYINLPYISQTIVMDYPYNRKFKDVVRVNNWLDIENYFTRNKK